MQLPCPPLPAPLTSSPIKIIYFSFTTKLTSQSNSSTLSFIKKRNGRAFKSTGVAASQRWIGALIFVHFLRALSNTLLHFFVNGQLWFCCGFLYRTLNTPEWFFFGNNLKRRYITVSETKVSLQSSPKIFESLVNNHHREMARFCCPIEIFYYFFKDLLTSTRCITALIEAPLCITHADDQMLEIYRVVDKQH